jgi:hypothetical protein
MDNLKNKASEIQQKWQKILRLKDWDIKTTIIEKNWRKSGDIKIDQCNKMAAVMINSKVTPDFLEEVIVHELLHLKLWKMDQMIESLLISIYGENEEDPKRNFAYDQFMLTLESTTQDLTKALLSTENQNKEFNFKRVDHQIKKELGEAIKSAANN